MTDARLTQEAIEQWASNTNAQAQATQIAIEQWGLTSAVGTRVVLTQLAIEQWAPPVFPVVSSLSDIGITILVTRT